MVNWSTPLARDKREKSSGMRRGDKGDICRVIRNRVEANLLGGSFPAGLLPESRASSKTSGRGGGWVLENRDGIPWIPFKRSFLSFPNFFPVFPIISAACIRWCKIRVVALLFLLNVFFLIVFFLRYVIVTVRYVLYVSFLYDYFMYWRSFPVFIAFFFLFSFFFHCTRLIPRVARDAIPKTERGLNERLKYFKACVLTWWLYNIKISILDWNNERESILDRTQLIPSISSRTKLRRSLEIHVKILLNRFKN